MGTRRRFTRCSNPSRTRPTSQTSSGWSCPNVRTDDVYVFSIATIDRVANAWVGLVLRLTSLSFEAVVGLILVLQSMYHPRTPNRLTTAGHAITVTPRLPLAPAPTGASEVRAAAAVFMSGVSFGTVQRPTAVQPSAAA
ncbi:hypothetical protein H257_14557 [Aphanomyces astaci]|uniref:Uncharacterized protein n=1 Tax=Aphanomyces astaci TaxID=112090 RepID=W4FS91_APHAT|nr:hypothetical protein H257_14557 [Aphanomyces astaci]ETV69694.1 hypothetical protein H257_14557 [Aphanomyces astaci]|eukprot:XP_009840708.1 hypothetical protein H257_14557 [Aphanomyces astaci]